MKKEIIKEANAMRILMGLELIKESVPELEQLEEMEGIEDTDKGDEGDVIGAEGGFEDSVMDKTNIDEDDSEDEGDVIGAEGGFEDSVVMWLMKILKVKKLITMVKTKVLTNIEKMKWKMSYITMKKIWHHMIELQPLRDI